MIRVSRSSLFYKLFIGDWQGESRDLCSQFWKLVLFTVVTTVVGVVMAILAGIGLLVLALTVMLLYVFWLDILLGFLVAVGVILVMLLLLLGMDRRQDLARVLRRTKPVNTVLTAIKARKDRFCPKITYDE